MTLVPWHQARDGLVAELSPLPSERVVTAEALGRVAAAPVRSRRVVPPVAVAAMDGVAVRADETPGRLPLAGDRPAGSAPEPSGRGCAVHIATGAALPGGTDSVVRRELVVEEDGHAVVPATETGRDVRLAGSQLRVDDLLLDVGVRVRPGHLALLAIGGVTELEVRRRPRAAVLVTGAEVVRDAVAADHQVPDANGPMLSARLRALGAEVAEPTLVDDDPEALAGTLRDLAAANDLVVVTGGTSVGRHDHLADVLAAIGRGTAWRLALRPAKPLVTGTVDGTPVLGLPGNPNAARVSFELLARPALASLSGTDPAAGWRTAALTAAIDRTPDGRTHVVAGRWASESDLPGGVAPGRGSRLSELADADVLILAPDGGALPRGHQVRVLALDA